MTTPASRLPGFYGRRPPKRAAAIRFSRIRSWSAAAPPPRVDYLAAMGGGWDMLGNGPDDSVFPGFGGAGDCVAVWWSNTRRVITTTLGASANPPVPAGYPPWSMVLAVYQTQNPDFDPAGDPNTTGPGSPADGGMDIQTLLEFLVAHPGFADGGTLLGFAAVDYTNPEEVQAAIDAGGVLCAGINVQAAQQDQFGAGQPWDWVPGSQLDGGHCTAVGGYGAAGPGATPAMGGDQKFITWAQETSFTDNYWAQGVEELWFPIWAEQLGTAEFQAGVSQAAFAAEYESITGKPFPGGTTPPPVNPPVPPVPPVTPPPGPVTADAADLAMWAPDVRHWVREHQHGEERRVAHALLTWAAAKGLT